jgi:hypothetical protein
VSNKRKLRRAQADRSATPPTPSRAELRKQTAEERFKKSGSDKLWLAMLGWTPERSARIWLAQAIHDGARAKERGALDVAKVQTAFSAHSGSPGEKLGDDLVTQGVDVWLASGDAHDARDPAPKWHFLANLSAKLGLGDVTPEGLAEDWEAWISLGAAGPWHKALLGVLGQAEQAAVALHGLTQSERISGMVNLTRAMWSALAYGDDESFDIAKRAGDEWLERVSKRMPAR